jgi:hypothetical protein
MARRLITRAELSRLAGVSDRAITKACEEGKLKPACDPNSKQVNADHPAVIAYLDGKGRKPLSVGAAPKELTPPHRSVRRRPAPERTQAPKQRARADAAPTDADDDELSAINFGANGEPTDDWTLREITDLFGTQSRFSRWLDARKKLADIKEKDLKNWESEGGLIPREGVRVHVFGAIEEMHKRLLLDIPKNLARTLYGMANGGKPVEEAEKVVRDKIGSLLRPVKDKAARALRKTQGDGGT